MTQAQETGPSSPRKARVRGVREGRGAEQKKTELSPPTHTHTHTHKKKEIFGEELKSTHSMK